MRDFKGAIFFSRIYEIYPNLRVDVRCSRLYLADIHRTHTISPRKYRYYTLEYPHDSHVYRKYRRCDKTWSLSRTCSRRVCLSFFMYTFIKGKSAMVSLERELFSLPLSLLSSPCCLICFRLRRAIPPACKLFSLSPLPRPPQAPSSSSDRCPALSRMSSVALVSSVDVSSSRTDRKSGAPSLSFE